jgi:glutathione peroxidase-family protein
MKKINILITVMLMILSVLSSCKKSSEVDSTFPPTNPVVGIYRGNIATNFTETDSQGNEITLESFRGNVILLTFSAMWCGPCRLEAPELVNLYNTYKEQGLEIVQCIYQEEAGNPSDLSDLARWINEFGMTFTVFNDPDRSTVNTYNFDGIPYNVLIGRDFIIWYIIEGYDPDTLRRRIEELL